MLTQALLGVLLETTPISSSHGSKPPSGAFGPLIQTVFEAILEVFLMCFMGWLLARRGILDKKTQKQLNRVNVSLFTPCLLFSKVAFSLSPEKLRELWIIPILFVFVTAVSAVIAYTIGSLLRLRRSQRNFAMAASMFNNSNSLPIALMQSLVVTVPGLKWGSDDNKDAMLGRALGYLVLYSTLGMMLRWSYGVRLLQQADEDIPVNPDSALGAEVSPLIGAASAPHTNNPRLHLQRATLDSNWSSTAGPSGTQNPQSRRPTALLATRASTKRFFYSFPNSPARSGTPSPTSPPAQLHDDPEDLDASDSEWPTQRPGGATLPQHNGASTTDASAKSLKAKSLVTQLLSGVRSFSRGFVEFMTMPLYAALGSIIVALTPPLQHVLSEHVQPVKGFLTSAGSCSIPVTLVVLGAYFYQEPPKDQKPSSSLANNPQRVRSPWASATTLAVSVRDAFKMRGLRSRRNSLRRGVGQQQSEEDRKAMAGETKTVFVSVISRMILTPIIVLPLVAALAYFGIHPVFDDPVFVCSTVLLISAPPALTLAQITQAASGDAFERLISRTIFWAYCIFTPPLTLIYVIIALHFSRL
ncbi:hypothetical protein DL93DRAFT_2057601 [Clavulina sp. PMI_390]|nr:hypothetical protein DL93DRAFT_2057601 [Clavulina sp. PMI_390]